MSCCKAEGLDLQYYKIDKTLPDLVLNKDNIGIDLYARVDIDIRVEENIQIPLNVVLKGDKESIYLLFPRSSMFKHYNIILTNSIGLIDPTYEGINDEIKASVCRLPKRKYIKKWIDYNNKQIWYYEDDVINYSENEPSVVTVKKGDRIAQLVILDRKLINSVTSVETHWGSEDRGGFGSTGKN